MHDCVIIGAGLAGLVAAGQLVSAGRDVVVLEARERVGGRIESLVLADGTVVDLGAQWISANHTEMLALVERLALTLTGTARGDVTVKLGGSVSNVPGQDEIEAGLNPFEIADLGQGLTRLRRLGERIVRDEAWASANAAWLGQPLRRWLRSNVRTPGGQAWFARVFDASFGVRFAEVTLLEGLHRTNGGIDMESLISVNGGSSQQRVVGGMAQVTDALAAELGERVRLEAPVARVEAGEEGVTVTLRDGSTMSARSCIVTLPPKLAVALDYEPPLAPWRAETAASVPAGSVIRAVAAYERPWWRDAGFSGQLGADEGSVRVLFDVSDDQAGRSTGVLTGFFGVGQDADLARRSMGLREVALNHAVTEAFGAGPALQVYLERDWLAEEFTGGCHGAHFAPQVWGTSGPLLGEPHHGIRFAGAEYAARANGYLEGALTSARDVARALADELGAAR